MENAATSGSSLDRSAKIVTWLVLGGIPLFLILGLLIPEGIGLTVTAAILFITAIICWLLTVQEYRLTEENLQIRRSVKPISIDLNRIVEVRQIDPEEMKATVRLLGVGGLFGWTGRFTNRALGPFLLYSRHRQHLTLIRTDDRKKYAIGPDDLDFINHLIDRVKRVKESSAETVSAE